MPNAVDSIPAPIQPVPGSAFTFANDAERRQVIDAAFDYRGDITLHLQSGATMEGYLFNRNADGKPPTVQMLVKGQEVPQNLPYVDIAGITFSGRDTADGKSYQTWKEKKHGERQAEAEAVKKEMEAQGYL
ncbi:MAG: hypothetical protein PW734_02765 [Verrucomicrobium sp.]|nr:hypothetical protein [Verrucomicrobium sp.]